MRCVRWFKQLFKRLFGRSKTRIGLYGPPNSGKTTLANRICADWLGEEMGSTSKIAHETREIRLKEDVIIKNKEGKTVAFSLADTPGIATRIDYKEFTRRGLSEEEAKARAKEATVGVIQSIDWLEKMDCVILVLDSAKEPSNQVNTALLEYVAQHKIPTLIIANKIDLRRSKLERVRLAFPNNEVLGISAKCGDNIDAFYEALFALTKKA